MEDSIFTKIIKGEVPCFKVYEDERTFAFLDIHPIQPGHVLVVPKKQVPFVWDLDDEDYQALMATVKKVAGKLRAEFPDKDRIGVMVEGLDVANHAHVKVFPFSRGEYRTIPDMDTGPDFVALTAMRDRVTLEESD